MSSAASEKSNIPMFSLIRDGVTDFGMTTFPSSMCQRKTICAGVLPYLRESAVTARVGEDAPLGQRTPRLRHDAVRLVVRTHLLLLEGRVQLHLIDSGHEIPRRSRRGCRCHGWKFDTPIARARPLA